MNREELMKKIELARVGNGTQTYNDVVLTLTKDETLELLQYIEQLEIANKNNEGLVRENVDLINRNLELQDENQKLKEEHYEILNSWYKLKKALDLIKDYLTIANDVPLMTFAERCFTEEEVKLLKEVLEEK